MGWFWNREEKGKKGEKSFALFERVIEWRVLTFDRVKEKTLMQQDYSSVSFSFPLSRSVGVGPRYK
jgi:hypothetical protein